MGVYGPALVVINFVLLVSATALIYLGNVLINFYHLSFLDFVSSFFSAVPALIVSVGVIALLVSSFGLVAAALQQKHLLAIYCLLIGATFIIQAASIFTASELRSELEQKILQKAGPNLNDQIIRYYENPSVMSAFDTVQQDFSCCGLFSLNQGYLDWNRGQDRPTGVRGVPDSCCLKVSKGCGENIFDRTDNEEHQDIFTHGCMSIMEGRFERDIQPLMLVYIGVGAFLALLQVTGLALAASYISAIRRREKGDRSRRPSRQMYERPSTVMDNNDKMYSDTKMYSGTIDSGVDIGTSRSSRVGTPRTSRPVTPRTSRPVTPSGGARSDYRSSLYVEPSSETGTCI